MNPFSQIVQAICRKNKSLKRLRHHLSLQDTWDFAFGQLAKDITLRYVRDNTIFVSVDNPIWKTELEFYKFDILDRINQHEKKGDRFSDIRVIVDSEVRAEPESLNTEKLPAGLSFLDKIKYENNRKKKLGYPLCKKCGLIRSESGCCEICLAEAQYTQIKFENWLKNQSLDSGKEVPDGKFNQEATKKDAQA